MLSLFLLALSAMAVSAQELQLTQFEETIDPDAVRNREDDANGVACALVKFGLIAKDPVFSGAVKQEYKDGEWWVYLPNGLDNVLIKTSNFVPFICNFGRPVQSLFTYRATVQPKQGNGGGGGGVAGSVSDDMIHIDVPGCSGFNMVLVKPGMFEMGATKEQGSEEKDEKPVHWVKITKPYYIGETEVTQAVYEAVMGNNPSSFIDPEKPVEGISWSDAQRFINRLNSITGRNFEMPTEAQWEYAARGGHKAALMKFSGSMIANEVGWYGANSGNRLHNVKELKPNEIGAYDMSGNVYELCLDYKNEYPKEAQTDPVSTNMGKNRVRRGGSWMCGSDNDLRNAFRRRVPEDEITPDTGIRLVLLK